MDISVVKKLIKKYKKGHADFIRDAEEGERYYKGENDILTLGTKSENNEENPIRSADNRVPSTFQSLLVDQKASYLFTIPPIFDTKSDEANKKIKKALGDDFSKVCKDLSINASNKKVAWLHTWKDDDNKFQFAVVPSEQVIPIFSSDLKKRLIAVLRNYLQIDEETGDNYIIYEYWTDKECYAYRIKEDLEIDKGLEEYYMFTLTQTDYNTTDETNVLKHDFKRVPFIPFFNNNTNTNDLKRVKRYIDTYDKVFSGFINELDDIQDIIFVLKGYDGTDLKEFFSDIKNYKAVKMEADSSDEKTSLDTIHIEIPVEAREKILQICEKQIYKFGQGVNPEQENFGQASGVALDFIYSLLELKAGLTETEFRLGFGILIRMLCDFLNIQVDEIEQTWTRNRVRSNTEAIEMASTSKGVISDETIVKNHPWVTDPKKELDLLRQQQQENQIDQFDNVPFKKDKE